MFKKILITSLIIYIPNSLHFPTTLGFSGLNVFNIFYITLLLLYLFKKDKPDYRSPLFGALNFYYFSAFVALLISLLSTEHMQENIIIFKNIITYSSLYFIVFALVDDEDELKYYIKVIYFVVFMMAVEIVKEKMSFGLGSSKRVAGAFGHTMAAANYAGVFLAIFLPLLLKNYISKNQFLTRPIFSLGIFVLGIFALFYTYSRQAYASLLLTTILNITKRKIPFIFLSVFLLNYNLWLPESVSMRIESTQVEGVESDEQLDDSSESRFVIWGLALDNIILRYPQGIGLNEFQNKIDPFMPDWIHARDAHSSFVLIFSENGVLGILAFILLLIKMYSTGRLIKKEEDNEDLVMLGEGYQLLVIAVVLGNVFSSTFYSPEVMGNFWILSALIHRYYFVVREKDKTA